MFVVGETTTPAVTGTRHPGRRLGIRDDRRDGTGVAAGAAALGAAVLAVTADPASALAAESTTVLTVPAATKYRRATEAPTIQPLSSLFDQATHIALDVVCLLIADSRGVDNTEAVRQHANTE